MSINWNKVVDGIQIVMIGIVLFILTTCIILLLAFDSLVGTGSMMEMTQDRMQVAAVISLVTTGLQTALAFMAYLATERGYGKLGIGLLLGTGLLWVTDIFFDSLTADVLRYGGFVMLKNLPETEYGTQLLYRFLIGGTSSIGEFLGVAIIVGMPELKAFISNAIPGTTYSMPRQVPTQRPINHNTRTPYNTFTPVVDNRQDKAAQEKATIERLNASRNQQEWFPTSYDAKPVPEYRKVTPEQEATDLEAWLKSKKG